MISAKVALVTGGGTGIGKAIALKLAKNGAKVAIASRSSDKVQRPPHELNNLSLDRACQLQMDVRDKADVERGR